MNIALNVQRYKLFTPSTLIQENLMPHSAHPTRRTILTGCAGGTVMVEVRFK